MRSLAEPLICMRSGDPCTGGSVSQSPSYTRSCRVPVAVCVSAGEEACQGSHFQPEQSWVSVATSRHVDGGWGPRLPLRAPKVPGPWHPASVHLPECSASWGPHLHHSGAHLSPAPCQLASPPPVPASWALQSLFWRRRARGRLVGVATPRCLLSPSACYYLSSRLPLARLPQRPARPPAPRHLCSLIITGSPAHLPAALSEAVWLPFAARPHPQDLSPSTLGRGPVSGSGLPRAREPQAWPTPSPSRRLLLLAPATSTEDPAQVNPLWGVKAAREFKRSRDSPVTVWIGQLQRVLNEYSERIINLPAST